MSRATRTLVVSTSVILAALQSSPTFSQSSQPQPAAGQSTGPRGNELQITVTANRSETAIQRTGSAITVVSAEEIRKTNPGSMVDVLRSVPGLVITATGGPGGTTTVSLRGANAGQTLVLVDGVKVNDPSSGSGEFDFAAIAPGLIERVEVLRGPQSALYGSNAIGGVINIITKRGRGPFQAYGQIEGGSYGTLGGNAGAYGAKGPWNYAFAISSLKTDGFSSYGYRVGRAPNKPAKLEGDGLQRLGGYGRIGYSNGNGFRFEIGAMGTSTKAEYDASFGLRPDGPGRTDSTFYSTFAKAELDTFEGRLKHSLQVFANRTKRDYRSFSTGSFPPPATDYLDRYYYTGTRTGAEYQANLGLDRFGSLIVGTRIEREAIESFSEAIAPFPAPKTRDVGKGQSTRSAFALWQLPLGERLDVSLGGRIDDVSNAVIFRTWRATAAYRIHETGTKLRASAGTGGKAPTLYQLYGPYGIASLQAERSFGVDVGIDQSLFDGRVKLSVTGFANRMSQLIDFEFNGANCAGGLAARPFGCYANIARAETSGVEASADIVLWQDYVRLTGAYTWLKARDRATGLALARRPEHSGKIGLTITPYANWTIDPSITFVGKRFSTTGQRQRLAPYARLDTLVNYRVNERFDVYVRGENLTNARYQDVFNYGTTGRAVYAGMKTTW